MNVITREVLHELLCYDEHTGVFTWRVSPSDRVKAGAVAGRLNSTGCIDIRIKGSDFKAHRLAWLYVHGVLPPAQIDHINGNRADNRLTNLRPATNAENQQNRKPLWHNATGFVGVRKTPTGKYVASIRIDGAKRHLGTYDTPQEANKMYIETKRSISPFFEVCNE